MWRLNPKDLAPLKGGGGEPFVHFMDRLIRAEAACGGLAQSEIANQLRVNIKDGGVDTQVKMAIPHDKAGWFAVPTCWQFKAVDGSDIKDRVYKRKKNDLQKEITKPYVKQLIQEGYGYRLCLLGDLAPSKLKVWEAQLKKEALAINPQAPVPLVVHGGHLLHWAERFPALVAQLRNWSDKGLTWEAWQANCRVVTLKYVPNPEWETVRDNIRQHVMLTSPSVGGEACFSIGGAAGVGKTRLAFETLNEFTEAPSLVLYLADEQDAKEVATTIANVPDLTAILVADECSPSTRLSLNEILRGHTNRIRLICLDNTGERFASATGQTWLTADSLKNTEAVLAANFPLVPEDRRRQYASFSKGFVRFAADMCRFDIELATGDMSKLLRSVEDYVRERLRRIGGDFLPIVSLLALFNKIGSRDDVVGELEGLCSLSGYTQQQFHKVVRTVRDAPGFVVQAGRYWYVTPEIVARVLFAEGWEQWVGSNLGGFLEKLPAEFSKQLLERVATHGKEKVRSQVSAFFRDWFDKLTPSDLSDANVTTLAATLIETAPDEYLPILRSIVENAQPGELRNIVGHALGAKWGSRRTLVWLLEALVSFPEYFEDCESCLFRLALEESEPQIGNNATNIWSNLFSVLLSGTAAAFRQRLPVLDKRTSSPNLPEARLGFEALGRVLHRAEGRFLGEPVVAGRLRPDDWRPHTSGEVRDCYRAALEICGRHLNAGMGELRQMAFNVLVKSFNFLLRDGLFEDLRRIVTPDRITEDEARKLLLTIDDFLERERLRGRTAINDRAFAYLQGVQEWRHLFRPSSFSGRLRNVCARPLWFQHFSQEAIKDEVDALASMILKDPSLLTPELDWLATPDAPSAELLGFSLGRIDESGGCGRTIFEHAITHKSAPLLRGYIRGLVSAQRSPSPNLLASMTKLEALHPELAVDVLIYAGDSFDAFNRLLNLVDSKAVSARYLASLAIGLGGRELNEAELNRILPYFAEAVPSGDIEVAIAGLHFLGTYLFYESRHFPQNFLGSVANQNLAWRLTEGTLMVLTGQNALQWAEIVKKLMSFDAVRGAKLLARVLLAGDMILRTEAEKQLVQLASTNPDDVMNGFGAALLDPERGWMLQIDVCRDLVGQLPSEAVLAWVRRHGVVGARAIARHLPAPHLDEAGNPVVPEMVDTILREYDDDTVFFNFDSGTGFGATWSGNGAENFRSAAQEAKKFLNHPNRRIREWAKAKIKENLSLAALEDREHEERLLPS